MVSAGRVLLIPKGTWNSTDPYSMLDLVSYNGSSYIAKTSVPANTLPTNTLYWQLSAYGGSAANLAGNFAPLETTDYASRGYEVGDYLVNKDNQFCSVVDDITLGDELILKPAAGYNIDATSTETEIKKIYLTIDQLSASRIGFDGTASGLAAINTQDAIDEGLAAVNSDLSNEIITRAVNGAHNLFNIRASQINTSGTLTGTINDDESLSLNGTPTAAFTLPNLSSGNYNGKVYNLKPNTKYVITYGIAQTNSLKLQAFSKATSSDAWSKFAESTVDNYLEFTTPSSFYDVWIRILLDANTAVSALKIYPMICLASDKDKTHQPYAKTNRELTDIKKQTITNATYLIGNILVKKQNNIVNVSYGNDIYKIDSTTGIQLGTLNAEFRPSNNIACYIRTNSNFKCWILISSGSGVITAYCDTITASQQNFQFCATYIVD